MTKDAFYKKIVIDRRGGFCYELNGSFANLLKALGFKVSLLSARVARPNGTFSPNFDHMILKVQLEQPWLVDVGFGESFTLPKALDNCSPQTDDGTMYELAGSHRRQILSRWDRNQNSWKPQYSFTLQNHKLSDFEPRCRWQQTSPQSHFNKGRLVTRLTPSGRITLTDTKFIVTSRRRRVETLVKTRRDFLKLLRNKFSISLD